MTKEQREQFLKDAANNIIEEFYVYGIKFTNPTIEVEYDSPNKSSRIYIGVYTRDFTDGLKDTDEFIFRMFLKDTINEYIEKSDVKAAKVGYLDTDVSALKNQKWVSKLSKADQLYFSIHIAFTE